MDRTRLTATAAAAALIFCFYGCRPAAGDDAKALPPVVPASPARSAVEDVPDVPGDVETVVEYDGYMLHLEEQAQQPVHVHVWRPVTELRRTEDRPAWDEEILVEEAWTETVDEYVTVTHQVCRDCGEYLDGMTAQERSEHIKAHVMAGGQGGHYTEQFREKTGSKEIFHPARYRTVHHAAEGHEETVIIGWRCSCGAERQP